LIAKITILEDYLLRLERVCAPHLSGSLLTANSTSLKKDLRLFRDLVWVDERAQMAERMRVLETQNDQMRVDLETLIFKIEEVELEN
jgi:hypothetical protein